MRLWSSFGQKSGKKVDDVGNSQIECKIRIFGQVKSQKWNHRAIYPQKRKIWSAFSRFLQTLAHPKFSVLIVDHVFPCQNSLGSRETSKTDRNSDGHRSGGCSRSEHAKPGWGKQGREEDNSQDFTERFR